MFGHVVLFDRFPFENDRFDYDVVGSKVVWQDAPTEPFRAEYRSDQRSYEQRDKRGHTTKVDRPQLYVHGKVDGHNCVFHISSSPTDPQATVDLGEGKGLWILLCPDKTDEDCYSHIDLYNPKLHVSSSAWWTWFWLALLFGLAAWGHLIASNKAAMAQGDEWSPAPLPTAG